MSDNTTNNKRIAKNTALLYIRMLFTMGVTLYTSRVVLNILGIEDYGIYNVIGSIVTMFTFISSAMGNSTSRYITFYMGQGDSDKLNKVFNYAIAIHAFLAIIILILAETIGLWFLNTQINIPVERIVAANWLYQFSILSTMFAIMNVPFMSKIIAHEKMSAFAYISILDVILKLVIVYALTIAHFDKLIVYSFLILCIQIIDVIMYMLYCKHHFTETQFKIVHDGALFKEMTGFAGWSLIGNLIWIGYTQGINILLNIFCGPAVNAARGIAVQVQGAVSGFVINFQMAVNPQITKSYSIGDYSRVRQLIFTSSKFSFFLLLCLALPIMVEANTILSIWLVEVPDHTVNFVRLTLLMLLYSPLENPLGTSNNATGNIKRYQIIVGCFNIFIVIFGYLFLKLGYPPESVFVTQFVIVSVVQVVMAYLVHRKIQMSMHEYMFALFFKVWIVAILAAILPITCHIVLNTPIVSLLVNIPLSMICVIFCGYTLGLNQDEKTVVKDQVQKVFSKLQNRWI